MKINNEHKKLNAPNLRFKEFEGEWVESTIGEEFDLYSGNTPSRLNKDHFNGEINWISSGELKEHYIAETKEKNTDFKSWLSYTEYSLQTRYSLQNKATTYNNYTR